MASSTLPDAPPEETNNPGQEEYEKLTGSYYNPDPKDNQPAGNASDPRGEPTREDLAEAEANPDQPTAHENQVGRGYRRALQQPSRFTLSGRINRRRALFGGGTLGAIVAILMMLTIGSGPLQFIHVAQLEQRFHLAHQQDAGDNRMGHLYRFARSGGSAGETRLGWLGSKYHASMMADLQKIGLKPVYSGSDIYQGFEIDTSNKESPYYGKSEEEIRTTLAEHGADIKTFTAKDSKYSITFDGYKNQRASLGFLSEQIGDSKIPGALRVRVMSRYGLVSWHPMKIIQRKEGELLSSLYDKWKTSRQEQLKNGVETGTIDTTNAQEQDSKNKTTPAPGESGALTDEHTKSLLNGIKDSTGLKVGGALSTAVGLVCAVNEVNSNIGDLRYAQVIAPLIRTGMEAVTVGNQIMSGQDVSSTEMGFLAKNFNEVDAKGNIVSSWNQSASIRANEGGSGGFNIEQVPTGSQQPDQAGVGDALSGQVPGYISWVNSVPGVHQICGGVGSAVTGVLGFTLSIFSGGVASTVLGAFAGSLAQGAAVDKLSHFLSGQAVNVAAQGAQWGSNVDYGVRLAGNVMALQQGGTELTPAQSSQLSEIQNTKSQADFNSHNIAYRLFDPNDERSAISKVIDGSSPSLTQNVNHVASIFLDAGKNFGNMFKIFTPKAKAAAQPYDYGFPEYGYSVADLNNPAVDDPYANADAAAAILNADTNDLYKNRANSCFGVTISKVANPDNASQQLWDVVPSDKLPNPYDPTKYPSNKCNDTNDPNWLKIRFFILDTGIMEGYSCYKGDDQSCINDGFGDTPTTAAPATTATSTTDMSQVFNDSTSVACAAGTKDLGIQDGYHDGQVVKIRICAVSNIPSTSEESKGGYGVTGANGALVVNSRVSGAVYAMGQAALKDGVPLIAASGFRTMQHQQALFAANPDPARVARPGYSNHQMGLAIDFATLPSTPGPVSGNPVWDWLSKNAGSFGYKNYPAEAWHWSVTGN